EPCAEQRAADGPADAAEDPADDAADQRPAARRNERRLPDAVVATREARHELRERLVVARADVRALAHDVGLLLPRDAVARTVGRALAVDVRQPEHVPELVLGRRLRDVAALLDVLHVHRGGAALDRA